MKRAIAYVALFLPLVVHAQGTSGTTSSANDGAWQNILGALKPRSLGPTNMGGRIADIAVYAKEPRIAFFATAGGGLWKTENGGMTARPIFDRESSVSIGAVAVSQTNPDVIWVGSGEASSRNSVQWGDGVYVTRDGGKTWQNVGLQKTMHIARIVIDPRNENTVWVAAVGPLWGPSEDRGLYKTTDGGKTWTRVLYVDDTTGPIELIQDPKNPSNMLCAMWTRQRKAYDFTSGGPGSGLYRSTDSGKTWKKVTKGLPDGRLGRIGLNYFYSDPKWVVATVEFRRPAATQGGTPDRPGQQTPTNPPKPNTGQADEPKKQPSTTPANQNSSTQGSMFNSGGVYLSKDGGASWELINPLNPRPFYFSQPRFDPVDRNRIYVLGVSLHMSEDGGKSFKALQVNIHADNHAWWCDPKDPNTIYIGNDGGVYVSRDRAKTWFHLENMPIGQFYAVAFDNRKPYWVYGGLQDNGSWGTPTQSTKGGVGFWDNFNVGGGDGFHVQVDPNDWTNLYSESQGGAATRYDQSGKNQPRGIRPRGAAGETLRWNWSTPIYLSPWNSQTLYIGGNKLWKSVNRGDTWQAVSPDLTTNDPNKMKPGQNSVTPENTGAEAHCTIITISESPLKQGQLWVGTDDGLVQMSTDGGANWTNVTKNIPGLPANTWCSRVIASKWSDTRAYALFDGHRNADFSPYVYVTEDLGKTWTRLGQDLPQLDCTYVIREGLLNPDLLFLGSEMSLRVSLDRGKTWGRVRNEFPTVAVHDVIEHPRDQDLVIGTHGRSIWLMDVSALEQLTEENRNKDVFVPKPQPIYNLGRVTGAGWDGDQVFTSQNTQPGTTIYYWLKNAAAGDVKVLVSSADGSSSTELTGKGNPGLNSVRWTGRLRGRAVEPGDYRITVTVNGKEYVTGVHVEAGTDVQ